jgi:RimJ/RimL family protein N-acetyltransferase
MPETTTPILSTQRLTMTPHTLGDFEDCLAIRSDPAVTRYLGGIMGREETWSRLLRYAGHWQMLGFGYWAVRETTTGKFIGEIGFADYQRDTEPSFAGTPEAGWVTAAWAHGKGYASEAVAAMLEWGDRRPDFRRTVCMIDPENTASIRLAEKFGYTPFAETDYKTHPVILFERLRSISA